jgi:TonB family protein
VKAYDNEVFARMNAVWERLSAQNTSRLSIEKVKVRFDVAPDGSVYNLKIISNTGNSALAEVARRTVRETRLPPIPPAALAALPMGHMSAECDFIVYRTP